MEVSNPLSPPSEIPEMVEKCARAIYVLEYADDPDEIVPVGPIVVGEDVPMGPRYLYCVPHALACMEALMGPSDDVLGAMMVTDNDGYALPDYTLTKWRAAITRAMGR